MTRYVRVGVLANESDTRKYAEMLESSYRCARWRWWDDRFDIFSHQKCYPTADRLFKTIESLRKEPALTGGLKVSIEGAETVLYADRKLAEAPAIT